MSAPGTYDPALDPELELLDLLAEELVAGDVPASTRPGDGEIPAQLVVPLDDEAGATTVQVCFVPGLDAPPVLQYVVALDHELDPDAVATTARFLHLVNSTLPLTGFEMSETLSAVVFRYVQAVALRPLDPGVVAWPLSMIYHAVTRFDALIGASCTGTPYQELVAGFGTSMADLYAADPED